MRDLVGRAEGRLTLGAVVVDGEEGVGRRGEVGVNTLGWIKVKITQHRPSSFKRGFKIKLVAIRISSRAG